jgi:hypothetical protein
MGSTAGSRDNDFEATSFSLFRVAVEELWGAVGADDLRFKRNLQLLEQGSGLAHRAPVRLASHNNPDYGLCC